MLLAVVVLSAGVHGQGQGTASLSAGALRPFGSALFVAFTALLVVGGAVGVLIVVLLRPSRHKRSDDEPEWLATRPALTRLERVLATVVPLLLLAAIVVPVILAAHGARPRPATLASPGALPFRPSAATDSTGAVGHGAALMETGLALGAALVAAGAIALVVIRRRERLEPREARGAEARMKEALDTTIALSLEDLRREPDPRRAILAAYAQMERLFSRAGLARPRSETAMEYLGRILRAGSAPRGALLELTMLFQEARFSSHELCDADRESALAALRKIRETLA